MDRHYNALPTECLLFEEHGNNYPRFTKEEEGALLRTSKETRRVRYVDAKGKYCYKTEPTVEATAARNQLVMSCVPWAMKIAMSARYQHSGVETEDLISAAISGDSENVGGLIKAVEKCDERSRLTTFSERIIRQAIHRCILKSSCTIALPLMRTKHYSEETQKCIQQVRCGAVSIDRGFDIGFIARPTSLHDVLSRDDEGTNATDYAEENAHKMSLFRQALDEDVITKREHNVLMGLLIRGHTLRELGEWEGITKERVRQIKNDALYKLRKFIVRQGCYHDLLKKDLEEMTKKYAKEAG